MHVKDLSPNPENPRIVEDESLERLRASVEAFGDISGIIFNRKSKTLVTGHQRAKTFGPDTKITYVKKYTKPTRTGTVAEGYIEEGGEKFRYREVSWSKNTEKAASIAANNHAGEWDEELLGDWLGALKDDGFEMSLTMFSEDGLEAYMGDDSDTVKTKQKSKGKSHIMHQCPSCGHEFN